MRKHILPHNNGSMQCLAHQKIALTARESQNSQFSRKSKHYPTVYILMIADSYCFINGNLKNVCIQRTLAPLSNQLNQCKQGFHKKMGNCSKQNSVRAVATKQKLKKTSNKNHGLERIEKLE